MTEAINRLAPEIQQVAAYHMGWTDADGNPIEAPGGKGIRPTLAVLGAEAAWAESDTGVPGGVAIELVHNFSLIHDDIIDTDTERHHRATVWSVYGVGRAIVAGDALQILAHQVLLESPSAQAAAASAALADATAAMIAGQADDIAFERRRDVSVEQCTAMSAAKTGALLGASLQMGAIVAGAPSAVQEGLRRAGRLLGVAFQLRDDWLGVWGDPELTGKSRENDLARRKLTYPLTRAYEAAGPEQRQEFRELYRAPGLEEAPRIRALLEQLGGPDLTAGSATDAAARALREVESCGLDASRTEEFSDVARYVAERTS